MLSALGLGKPKELPRKPSSRNVGTNSQIKLKSGSRIQIGKKGGGIMLDAGTKKLMNRNSGQLIKKLSGFLFSIGKSATDVGEDNPPTERTELTPAQLEEDMPGRVLEARDPCATQVSISYSYITNTYEKKTNYDQLVIHFEMDGETILKESEEAKIQEEIDENRIHLIRETVKHHELMDSNQE